MMVKARYALVSVTNNIVTIRDLGGSNTSITNDAKAVVSEIYANWGDQRIQYYDTMGRLDELLHDHGVFIGFRAVDK